MCKIWCAALQCEFVKTFITTEALRIINNRIICDAVFLFVPLSENFSLWSLLEIINLKFLTIRKPLLMATSLFSGTMWMNWILVAFCGVSVPLLVFFPASYKRLDVDRTSGSDSWTSVASWSGGSEGSGAGSNGQEAGWWGQRAWARVKGEICGQMDSR